MQGKHSDLKSYFCEEPIFAFKFIMDQRTAAKLLETTDHTVCTVLESNTYLHTFSANRMLLCGMYTKASDLVTQVFNS